MNFKRRRICARIQRIFVVLFVLYFCYFTLFKCTWTPFPVELAQNKTWYPVGRAKTAYVFSAYLDESRHVVVVIGAMTKDPITYLCQLWSADAGGNSMDMDRSYPRAISPPEHHDKKYAMTLFECPFRSARFPQYVSLITNTCDTPLNLIRIDETKVQSNYRRKFTVCLSPLNFMYSRAYELIEWIELNRILGAEKFVVYNYSSASNVKEVLDYYSKRGFVEVIQWPLPMAVDTYPATEVRAEIHYFGQTAALHDCLYRNKRESEFIVNIDLDEFIIPHGNETTNWKEIVRKVDTNNAKAFVFKNTHFRRDLNHKHSKHSWMNDYQETKRFKLTTLQTFQREVKVYIKGVKSKYMVRTDGLLYLMIHFVPELPLSQDITISEEIALLHHYKNFEHDPEVSTDSVPDYTVLDKYGDKLISNVERVWDELSRVDMNSLPIKT
ncbi:uncharacterized protein LOC123552394 [Mercenaria mercenaria]|uniref:uncharacterized protein LOC123552394 n=1 Tax=Mercenaria mercenaria TaxID=6596 RepID=UPI00234F21EF|nr:uncharacterized protein LOC123552394 [Mercenaria mercenaria]